jgi:hypothetical protein
MHSTQSPTRAQPEPRTGDGPTLPRRLKLPALLGGVGGLGLLGCVACCSLPLLGIIGIGGGAAAFFEILEPLSAGLLALGAVAAVVALARRRKNRCAEPTAEGAACSADGSCGCGPEVDRLSGAAER